VEFILREGLSGACERFIKTEIGFASGARRSATGAGSIQVYFSVSSFGTLLIYEDDGYSTLPHTME